MSMIVSAANVNRQTIGNEEEFTMKEIVSTANESSQTIEKKEEKTMSTNRLIKALSIVASTTVVMGISLVESGKCFRCHDGEVTKRIGIVEPEATRRLRLRSIADIAKDSNAAMRFREVQKTQRQENRLGFFSSSAIPAATSVVPGILSAAFKL